MVAHASAQRSAPKPAAKEPALRVVKQVLPKHDHVEKHLILLATKEHGVEARKKRAEKVWRSSGEVACARVREYAFDLGAEMEWGWGWMAAASRSLGLGYTTLYAILTDRVTTISHKTVDNVARVSGVPVRIFYDNES